MSEIHVPTDILNVTIGRVVFEDYAHDAIYTPNDVTTDYIASVGIYFVLEKS